MWLEGRDHYLCEHHVTALPAQPMRDGQCDFARNIIPNRIREDDLIQQDGHAVVMSRSNLPRGQQAMSERYHAEWSEHRWLSIQAPGRWGLIQLIAPRDQLSKGRAWCDIQLDQMRLHGYHGRDVREWSRWVDPFTYVVPDVMPCDHVWTVTIQDLVHRGDQIIDDMMSWFDRSMQPARWLPWLDQWRLWRDAMRPHVAWLQDPHPVGLPVHDELIRWLSRNHCD